LNVEVGCKTLLQHSIFNIQIASMIIDIIFLLLMVFALVKGYRNGFVVAVFSFLGIIIGLAAAMKLSTVVAGWLKDSTSISATWLPFLSFLLVMIGVMLLVRLGAKLIQSAMELVMLGWLNKLSGIVLYAALFITLYSVLLFYAIKLQWLKPEVMQASQVYAFVQPWGPKAIDLFGAVIPWFKGMFEELSRFFENIHQQVK
jgi:membrane protein required for colicin V production